MVREERKHEASEKKLTGQLGAEKSALDALTTQQTPIYFSFSRKGSSFLSNFYCAPFDLDGARWKTVEHFYQASKFNKPEIKSLIREAATAQQAKIMGKTASFPIKSDWDSERMDIMKRAVRAKFEQNVRLREQLVKTGCAQLIEATSDGFWGQGRDGTGRNELGRILMALRSEFQKAAQAKGSSDVVERPAADEKSLSDEAISSLAPDCSKQIEAFFDQYILSEFKKLDLEPSQQLDLCRLMSGAFKELTKLFGAYSFRPICHGSYQACGVVSEVHCSCIEPVPDLEIEGGSGSFCCSFVSAVTNESLLITIGASPPQGHKLFISHVQGCEGRTLKIATNPTGSRFSWIAYNTKSLDEKELPVSSSDAIQRITNHLAEFLKQGGEVVERETAATSYLKN